MCIMHNCICNATNSNFIRLMELVVTGLYKYAIVHITMSDIHFIIHMYPSMHVQYTPWKSKRFYPFRLNGTQPERKRNENGPEETAKKRKKRWARATNGHAESGARCSGCIPRRARRAHNSREFHLWKPAAYRSSGLPTRRLWGP